MRKYLPVLIVAAAGIGGFLIYKSQAAKVDETAGDAGDVLSSASSLFDFSKLFMSSPSSAATTAVPPPPPPAPAPPPAAVIDNGLTGYGIESGSDGSGSY